MSPNVISLFKILKGKGAGHVDVHQLRVLNSYMVCKNGFIFSFIYSIMCYLPIIC